jgi:hypothetical protein
MIFLSKNEMKEHLIEEEKCIKIMYQPSVGPRGLIKILFLSFLLSSQ